MAKTKHWLTHQTKKKKATLPEEIKGKKNEVIGTQIENNKVYNDNLTHL